MAANVKFVFLIFACFLQSQASASSKQAAGKKRPVNSADHSDDGESWNPAWSTSFPDRPLQLVKPDFHHKTLVLDEDNVKMLHRMKGAVATIAVVGKFHSGKSFLLNQLMGKSNGFGIGPYVKPQTMGIWMWGKPLEMKLENGQEMSVIFLDTEGFAATNVSENYDAKIFAVATLLSSYLIYNSVKIIDQSDIDYLEALARRTQLFALRSQMSKAKWMQDFNHDLLSFPPLLWVVQDFVQMTENGESPREWLHRLMTTHAREKEDYEISLLGIFKSVDCQTLFLPAVTKSLLINLSRATEDDLTEEYKQERNQLIDTLRKHLKPKEKNDKPITGPEIATLLEILVKAANEGSLAEIPSRWDTFIKRLEDGATEDCLLFYEAEMAAFHKQHGDQPINPTDLENWHQVSFNQSISLLQQLLFGLKNTVEGASRLLQTEIILKHSRAMELNVKKIKLRCTEVQHQLELEVEELLLSVNLPVASKELQMTIASIYNDTERKHSNFIKSLLNGTDYDIYKNRLKSSIAKIGETFLLRNKQALEKVLDEAVTKATGFLHTRLKNQDGRPLTPSALNELMSSAQEEATQLFTSHSVIAQAESLTDIYRGMLKAHYVDEGKKLAEENDRNLHQAVMLKVQELIEMFRSHTEPVRLSLPMNETDLNSILSQERLGCENMFREEFQEFVDMSSFTTGYLHMGEALDSIVKLRHHENVQAFAREVNQPLSTAKQIILLSADKFHTVFSVKQYIQRVCLLNLNEGRPKTWPVGFKINVIDHYVSSDVDLTRLLESKEGMWSSVIGFFQWLMWIVGI